MVVFYVTSILCIRYFNPKPSFEYIDLEGGYQCKLSLPSNAAFQTIVGPLSKNAHLAKQLVCLEACKKLHKMGALDDHLRPSVEEPLAQVHTVKNKKTSSGAGTSFLLINRLSFVLK